MELETYVLCLTPVSYISRCVSVIFVFVCIKFWRIELTKLNQCNNSLRMASLSIF